MPQRLLVIYKKQPVFSGCFFAVLKFQRFNNPSELSAATHLPLHRGGNELGAACVETPPLHRGGYKKSYKSGVHKQTAKPRGI